MSEDRGGKKCRRIGGQEVSEDRGAKKKERKKERKKKKSHITAILPNHAACT